MELDRACPEEGPERPLCCNSWVDTRRKREERLSKSLVENGRGRMEHSWLEHMDHIYSDI